MCTRGTFDIYTGDYTLSTTDKVVYPEGSYTFTIVGSILELTASTTFTLNLVDACKDALTLSFTGLDGWYKIKTLALDTFIDESQIVSSKTEVTCPAIVKEVVNASDESALDFSVFTYNALASTLTTQTNDITKDGEYYLRVKAYYVGYTNVTPFDFMIEVDDTCKDAALTVFFDPLDNFFDFGFEPSVSVVDPDLVDSSETEVTCPSVVFDIVNTDGSAIDDTIFTYDDAAKEFLTFSEDLD